MFWCVCLISHAGPTASWERCCVSLDLLVCGSVPLCPCGSALLRTCSVLIPSAAFFSGMHVCAFVCLHVCVHNTICLRLLSFKVPDSHSSPFQKQLISHPTSCLAATSKTKFSPESHVLYTQTHHLQSLIQNHQSGWSTETVAARELAVTAKTQFDEMKWSRKVKVKFMRMTVICQHKPIKILIMCTVLHVDVMA